VLCEHLSEAAAELAIAVAAGIEVQLRRALGDSHAAIRAYVEGTISATVPAATVDLSNRQSAEVSAAASGALVRVALADDDPLARVAIAAMLERADWIELVGVAPGVEEIVELAADMRPEVVVLDWMMPGGGGRDAARRILDDRPGTLIVALTSSDSLEALTEMISAGASCLVAKGGSADQLVQTIARTLKTFAATRAAEEEARSARRGKGGGMRLDDTPRSERPLDPGGVERLQTEFGSSGILGELVELFGSQTPGRLISMRSAIEAGDAGAVSGDAHQLKGGCLTLAANHMAELCDKLEMSAGGGSLEGAAALVDQIQRAFEQAHAALLREVT
jgi:DNA-binding NarL/FixJ family response regulator